MEKTMNDAIIEAKDNRFEKNKKFLMEHGVSAEFISSVGTELWYCDHYLSTKEANELLAEHSKVAERVSCLLKVRR